ncbi:hypothetical protein GIB67_019031 [Kingdonia uniflora]|uniref:Uncharacterized protein n=1 Tax=Kingdonia uniflora TaxID=39325 RepID=A0A7J7MZT7_9MAGN|nr:hypothetical protein GIB67_019031 [Kingdonia uniflora]
MATLQFKDDSMKVHLYEFDSSRKWQVNELRATGSSRDEDMEKCFSSQSVKCHSFVLDEDVELIECGKSYQYYLGDAAFTLEPGVLPPFRKYSFNIREEVMKVAGYSEHFLRNAWYIMIRGPIELQLFMAGDVKDKKMVLDGYRNQIYE